MIYDRIRSARAIAETLPQEGRTPEQRLLLALFEVVECIPDELDRLEERIEDRLRRDRP